MEQKDDAPLVNGIGHENEPLKGSKSDVGKQGRGKANGVSAKPAPKRKPEPGRSPRTRQSCRWILNSRDFVVGDRVIEDEC